MAGQPPVVDRKFRESPQRRRRARLMVGVGAVAVALVITAIYVTRNSDDEAKALTTRKSLAPELAAAADSLSAIEISKGDVTLALARQGDQWIVESSSGYPAKLESVRELVSGVAALELDEALTSKKDRHAELGLAWPDATGKSTLVRFVPAQGNSIELVLGEEKFTPKSQYARKLTEDQTWRCRGSVTVETQPSRWMTTELLSLPQDEAIAISYDGLELNRVQEEGKAAQWIASLGLSPVDASVWNEAAQSQAKSSLPTWLTRVEFDDVRTRGENWSPDPRFTVMFDTLRAIVRMEGMSDSETTWVRFSAEPKPDAPAVPEALSAAKRSPGSPYIPDWNAWSQEAAKWEFKLPAWKRSAITRIREPAKPAAAMPPAGPAFAPAAGR